MFVLTIDQRDSRKVGDKVPELLAQLKRVAPTPRLAFARSVGDEVQGVIDTPQDVLAIARFLLRKRDWYLGIGVAPHHDALPKRSADASGEPFVLAREAVEDAKIVRGSAPVSVRATQPNQAAHAQGLLRLLGVIYAARSDAAWEAIDELANHDGSPKGLTQKDVAALLGISNPAVSKRLRVAAYDEELGVLPLLLELLALLDSDVRG